MFPRHARSVTAALTLAAVTATLSACVSVQPFDPHGPNASTGAQPPSGGPSSDAPSSDRSGGDAGAAALVRRAAGNLRSVRTLTYKEVVVDGEVEVAGEEVAGAARQQAHRDTGVDETGRDRADRAVAAERADEVGPLLQGLLCLTGAGVVLRRLDPQRLTSALRLADGPDAAADGVDVVELRGVDDDRGATAVVLGDLVCGGLGRDLRRSR